MSNKTTIKKIHAHAYRVNGHLIEQNIHNGKWYAKDEISITSLFNFYKFLKYGAMDQNKLEAKRQELTIQKKQLLDKIIKMQQNNADAMLIQLNEIRLSTIIEELINISYNVAVYK